MAVPRNTVSAFFKHLAAVVGASVCGASLAGLGVRFGHVDRQVVGPAAAPLSISLAAAFLLVFLLILHRRRLTAAFDRFLPPRRHGLRLIALILVFCCGYEVVRVFLFMFVDYWPTDLPSYHFAGLALLDGDSPYRPELLSELAGRRVFPYLYPPLTAIVWQPLSRLPVEVAHAVWQVVSLAALIGSVLLCLGLAAPRSASARSAALVAAVAVPLGYPFYVAAQHGSVSVVLAFLLVLFFERLVRGRDVFAGSVLALACGIKALPALLLVYLVLKRRWRALIAAVVTGTALLGISVALVGFDVHLEFLTRIVPQIGYGVHSGLGFDPAFHPANQSINGFVSRFFCDNGSGCRALVGAVVLLFTLPTVWLAFRRPEVDSLEVAVVALLLLLISPITWFHHLVLLLVPAVVLAARMADDEHRPSWWPLGAVAFAVILAHDLGRPVMAVKHFPPWSYARLFMLALVYVIAWTLLWRDTRRSS